YLSVEEKNDQLVKLVRQWHVDGMVFHLNRGCEALALGQMENRLHLLKEGLPVMSYEGNTGDKREFDEAEVVDRVEAFMESLGLSKIATT
ncbi:MAG: 2-hydroxyacyl-CoA dehydratase family protein, partial [Dehalococcoidia bacterium]